MLLVVYGLTLVHLSAYGPSVCWQLGSKAVMDSVSSPRAMLLFMKVVLGQQHCLCGQIFFYQTKLKLCKKDPRPLTSLDYAVTSVLK